jgi:glycosyltransferase involved in cell wall biosynthesis
LEDLMPTTPQSPAAQKSRALSRPLRIGVIAHIQFPIRQPFAGGLEAFTHDIVLGLRARGHEVTLFARDGSAEELRVEPIIEHRCLPISLSEGYMAEHHAYLGLMQRIDSLGFDVIFNNTLHYVPATMASLLRTPMLTVLHTPPFFELINAYGNGRAAGRFCTVSAANARSWRQLLPECEVIPNGIDLQAWAPSATPPGEHALWFGRLVPEKGAHLAIEAARMAGMEIHLAGNMADDDYFRQYIEPLLGPRVHHLGHLSRAQLVQALAKAKVALVTPCWDEPFGLVVAEAMACGTPVAGFDRGAIADLVTENTGVVVPANDVEALAAAMPVAAGKSRQACRALAEQNWGYDLMLSRYEQLLAEVAANHA